VFNPINRGKNISLSNISPRTYKSKKKLYIKFVCEVSFGYVSNFITPRKFSALINKGLHVNLMLVSKEHLKVDSR